VVLHHRVIVLLGAFIGPQLRALTPRAGDARHAGRHLGAFISMRPAFQLWETPWIGLACFAIVLIAWDRPTCACPAACRAAWSAVIVGAAIGWDRVVRRLERLHAGRPR
jgi:AGZA family xanthine/uracil permease-like MFS transporter